MFLPRAIIATIGAALALGCLASVRPPPPVQDPASANAALIAIKVVNNSFPTNLVYFVRIEKGNDPLSQQVLIPSNYFEDGYVYLLNARPGRYAAVAAALLVDVKKHTKTTTMPVGGGGSFSGSVGVSYTIEGPIEDVILLPGDAIQGTLVDVKPDSVAFMGEWRLKSPLTYEIEGSRWSRPSPWSPSDGGADAAQLHYSRLAKAEGIGTAHRRGSEPESDRSDAAWQAFLPHARERLADTGWSGILEDAVK